MGDNGPETEQQLESRQKDEEYARVQYFSPRFSTSIRLDSISWISNHIDCFVRQSRGNQSIEAVCLCPHKFKGHDDGFWDKVGQAVGNLQKLTTIYIASDRENGNGTCMYQSSTGENWHASSVMCGRRSR
jgi:hypothetical protein